MRNRLHILLITIFALQAAFSPLFVGACTSQEDAYLTAMATSSSDSPCEHEEDTSSCCDACYIDCSCNSATINPVLLSLSADLTTYFSLMGWLGGHYEDSLLSYIHVPPIEPPQSLA